MRREHRLRAHLKRVSGGSKLFLGDGPQLIFRAINLICQLVLAKRAAEKVDSQ